MKGRKVFTKQEAQIIEALIEEKLKAVGQKQKSFRDKIRKIGFYASDFGIGGGYTVTDFRSVGVIDGNAKPSAVISPVKTVAQTKTPPSKLTDKINDETYVINLCDKVLKVEAKRQHRFDFLKGDSGTKLPVDAYYPTLNLVIEYHERQHTEEVKFFDKRITSSGIGRGEQRKLYDERRKTEIPKQGIDLVIFDYTAFTHTSSKRLLRNEKEDIEIISGRLKKYI